MTIEKSTMKVFGIAAAIVAFLASQFWGVPYYIHYVVDQKNKADAEVATQPQVITELVEQMEAVEGSVDRLDDTVVRVEGKIDHLTGLFIADLNRRAAE